MEFIKNIEKDEIQKLPLYSYEKDFIIVDNEKTFQQILPELFLEKIWGFDTETKPTFKKGLANQKNVSLLQLSNSEKTYLFRLNKLGLPKEITILLSDPGYIKIGVSIRDDIKSLQKLNKFEADGFIDLQNIVNEYGIEDYSLRKMAAIVLGIRISKAQQLSNWEADELTEKQIKYAATDSWISREIYLKLINSKK